MWKGGEEIGRLVLSFVASLFLLSFKMDEASINILFFLRMTPYIGRWAAFIGLINIHNACRIFTKIYFL